MSTKWKIISGFLIMIVLAGANSVIGYTSLSDASKTFTEYSRVARINVFVTDIYGYQDTATVAIRLFGSNMEPKQMEATRAGEAGYGFAVIADEVRKLTKKTMITAQEVAENIAAIQQSSQTLRELAWMAQELNTAMGELK